MSDSIARSLAMVAVVVLGVVLKRVGVLRRSDFAALSRIVLGVTLPCALITGFNDYVLDRSLLVLSALGFGFGLSQQVLALLLWRRGERKDRAFAVLHSGSFNIGAFATPYIMGFMGAHAMVHSTLFDIGGAMTGAGVGYALGMQLAGDPSRSMGRDVVRNLRRSPVLVTYVSLLCIKLLDLRFPDPVIAFTSLVGSANPFLAMLMIGVGLELRAGRSSYAMAAKVLCLRYATAVVAAVAFWNLLPFGPEPRLVLVMLVFAPVAAMTSGFVAKAGLDVEASTFTTFVSLVVAIVLIPTLFLVLQHA